MTHNNTSPGQDEKIRKEELKAAFVQELRELMRKHGVSEISAEDHWQGYAECGEDIRITATIDPKWEGDEQVRPYIEVNMGKGFYAEP